MLENKGIRLANDLLDGKRGCGLEHCEILKQKRRGMKITDSILSKGKHQTKRNNSQCTLGKKNPDDKRWRGGKKKKDFQNEILCQWGLFL